MGGYPCIAVVVKEGNQVRRLQFLLDIEGQPHHLISDAIKNDATAAQNRAKNRRTTPALACTLSIQKGLILVYLGSVSAGYGVY